MICEQCKAEGEPSRVIEEGTETTCIGFGPFYDQQGRHHSHDPNNHCTYYRCSRGHRWPRHWKAECPECGKWWKAGMVATDERCRHCGQPPRAEMQRDHPFWPWLMSRTGPAGEWQHYYCSEECAAHADEYSRKEWEKRHGK